MLSGEMSSARGWAAGVRKIELSVATRTSWRKVSAAAMSAEDGDWVARVVVDSREVVGDPEEDAVGVVRLGEWGGDCKSEGGSGA